MHGEFTPSSMSSHPGVNSLNARRRLDTSLSSLRSLRSARGESYVEDLISLSSLTPYSERSERSELGVSIPSPSVGFVRSLLFGTQRVKSELGVGNE